MNIQAGKRRVLEPLFLDSFCGGKIHTDVSLFFPEGRPLPFCLALGPQRLPPTWRLAKRWWLAGARTKAPASRALQVLDRCRQQCSRLVLSLLLPPSAR